MIDLDRLSTEQRNPASVAIDKVSTQEMMEIINREDHKVADAVEKILPAIALAVDLVADRLSRGGRLFYMGSGTSGRLGILDAVECPPTYSTDPEQIQGLIAGGHEAIFRAKEGAEDSEEQGRDDIWNKELTSLDVVMGISASGRTPYVLGGMKEARERGCAVLGLCCSRQSAMAKLADLCLTAKSDMASFVDSLAAPLSVINALLVSLGLRRREALTDHFRQLESIWDAYQVYLGDEQHD